MIFKRTVLYAAIVIIPRNYREHNLYNFILLLPILISLTIIGAVIGIVVDGIWGLFNIEY